MKGFKHMSPADARHIALLCVGVAILIIGAVLLSEGSRGSAITTSVEPTTQTASWLSCFIWGCSDDGDSTPPCVFTLAPSTIKEGESATLSWTKGGGSFTLETFRGPIASGTPLETQTFTKSTTPISKTGSLTVSPTQTVTYRGTPAGDPVTKKKHQCKVTLTVSGSGVPVPPIVTISSDAPLMGGVPTITAGSQAVITATFAAQTVGTTVDFITGAAINGPNSTQSAIKGSDWDTPASSKQYTFYTTTPGDYTFTPAVMSVFFPDWNDYGKAVTIHVVADPTKDVCSNISGKQSAPPANGYIDGSRCRCEVGFILDSSAGTCTSDADVCVGADFPGVQSTLPINAQHDTSNTCTCKSDYVLVTGSCIAPTVTEFYANPSLVRVGASTALYWKVQNPPATCRLTGTDGTDSVIPRALLGSGSMPTSPIRDTTVFTFRCGAAPASQATVRLIPVFDEI